jgi:hypothetical protein
MHCPEIEAAQTELLKGLKEAGEALDTAREIADPRERMIGLIEAMRIRLAADEKALIAVMECMARSHREAYGEGPAEDAGTDG